MHCLSSLRGVVQKLQLTSSSLLRGSYGGIKLFSQLPSSQENFGTREQNFSFVKKDNETSEPKTSDFVRGLTDQDGPQPPAFNFQQESRNSRPHMDFVRNLIEHDRSQPSRSNVEQNADIVHITLKHNNAYVALTDSNGLFKTRSISMGCVPELKGGSKMFRFAAEATAEHMGQRVREMGIKSVVLKVNGNTYFRKKKQAIMSFKEGYCGSRGGRSPIVYIEDTTRYPHNGCRRPKRRRT